MNQSPIRSKRQALAALIAASAAVQIPTPPMPAAAAAPSPRSTFVRQPSEFQMVKGGVEYVVGVDPAAER